MNIENYSKHLRALVNNTNIENWYQAKNKQTFCAALVESFSSNNVTLEILRDVLNNLLSKKAEDRFAEYQEGEEVFILHQGSYCPATIISKTGDREISVKKAPHDIEEVLIFTRSKEQIFIHMDGTKFSRLCKPTSCEQKNGRELRFSA